MRQDNLLRGALGWRLSIGMFLFTLSVISALGSDIRSNDTRNKKATAMRIESGKIAVDGELNESEWSLAQPIRDFLQQEPHSGEPPTERTEVRLLYDDQNLYVGVYCFDSEGKNGIIANDLRRDFPPFDGDTFLMVLDTFHDKRNGILLNTNPGGAQFDEQIGADGANINSDWDGIWYVKTKITESGWQAEEAIPFKTLRFRNIEHQVWGINFQRRIRRKNEVVQWSLIPRPYRANRVSLAGTLEGISGIQPGRNLYVKPYISAPLTRRRDDDVDFVPDAGFDVKYALGSQLTLDLTANTDFSQVEADDQQINLTRFSLFFPEKREFFLENSNIFQFGRGYSRAGQNTFRDLIPFFSRRIGISQGRLVPILGGTRLTGRLGNYTLGLLSLQQDQFEEIPSTNFSVIRLRRDLFRKSEIGAIFVNKHETGGSSNRTYGTDANFTFFRFLDISSFLLKTDTPDIRSDDTAGYFRIGWTDPLLTVHAGHLSIGEHFNPEVGFVPRRGIRKSTGEFALRPRPKERIPVIREFEPFIGVEYITDQDNVLETRTVDSRFTVTFQNSSVIWLGRQSRFERLTEPFRIRTDQFIASGDYQFDEYQLSLSTDKSRMFSGELLLTTGGFYDGDKRSRRLSGRFQPGRHFRAELTWTQDNIKLPSGSFDTNLVIARFGYSFNTKMFLNALIQYNTDQREVTSNIRFNLIHHSLSDFFLVYNERRAFTGEVMERALIGKLTYIFSF
ncbi:MAG: carbohydrate binding family 9 domain-containing protein [Acidobacteria bacterium]|nr:carbohydrate binding family 9 domain-containing protein [Acidobacteriota bacterium]